MTFHSNLQVVPIHKGGSNDDVSNYRPGSLTSVIMKAMKRLLWDEIARHITSNNMLSAARHGFLRNESCLLSFMDEITRIVGMDERVGV